MRIDWLGTIEGGQLNRETIRKELKATLREAGEVIVESRPIRHR